MAYTYSGSTRPYFMGLVTGISFAFFVYGFLSSITYNRVSMIPVFIGRGLLYLLHTSVATKLNIMFCCASAFLALRGTDIYERAVKYSDELDHHLITTVFPDWRFEEEQGQEEEETCPICLTDVALIKLECGHGICGGCFEKQQEHGDFRCCICRAPSTMLSAIRTYITPPPLRRSIRLRSRVT